MKATIQLVGGQEIVVDGLTKIKHDYQDRFKEITNWEDFIIYSDYAYIFVGSITFTTWGKNILFVKFEN